MPVRGRPTGSSRSCRSAWAWREAQPQRIARLMREAGLVGASHRHAGPTTTRRNKDDRPAPDLVDRDFNAAGPNQLWGADITYVPTMAGVLYFAVVLARRRRHT